MGKNSNHKIALGELVKQGETVFVWKRSRWRLTGFRNGQALAAVRLNRDGQPNRKAITFVSTTMVERVVEQA